MTPLTPLHILALVALFIFPLSHYVSRWTGETRDDALLMILLGLFLDLLFYGCLLLFDVGVLDDEIGWAPHWWAGVNAVLVLSVVIGWLTVPTNRDDA